MIFLFMPECMLFFQEQLRRYIDIKQSDLPPAIAAKKTREFRCPPHEQVKQIKHLVVNEEIRIKIL